MGEPMGGCERKEERKKEREREREREREKVRHICLTFVSLFG